MNELKTNIEQKSKERGCSKLSLKPQYWSEPFWKDLLNYWEKNEGHLHRSSIGSTNRNHVERLHSAGARSFNKIKEVYINICHTHLNFLINVQYIYMFH